MKKQMTHAMLMYDDAQGYRNIIARYMEKAGAAIKFFGTEDGEEALRIISQENPKWVCVDQHIAGAGYTGEEWIMRNFEVLKSRNTHLVTAYVGDVADTEWLLRNNVKLIAKAALEEKELWRSVVSTARNSRKSIPELPIEQIEKNVNERYCYDKVTSVFDRWVESYENRNQKNLALGTSVYSVKELQEELYKGSDAGKEFFSLFMEDFSEHFSKR